jgi:hypothetical protein
MSASARARVSVSFKVGLFNGNMRKLLYKWKMTGKNIFLFGDHLQLTPIGCVKIMKNEYLMKMISNNNYYLFKSNYRNMYTEDEYIKIINNKLSTKEKHEYIKIHNKYIKLIILKIYPIPYPSILMTNNIHILPALKNVLTVKTRILI